MIRMCMQYIAFELAKKRYQTAKDCRGELLVSASDDLTLFLWNPVVTHKPVARMTGV